MRLHNNRVHCVLLIVAVFWMAAPWHVSGQAGTSFEIVIGSGPHAGTYKLPESNTICMHMKAQQRFSAAYKDVEAIDPKTVSGAGINIFNPDDPGPKRGQLNIRFGDPKDQRPAPYEVSIPSESKGPLTLTRAGKTATATFQGQTKSGINVQVSAKCGSVDEF
jgi:hypothetical protein